MRVCNRKLAQRISEMEARLRCIRNTPGPISDEDASTERRLQEQIHYDEVILVRAGYDRHGRKVKA